MADRASTAAAKRLAPLLQRLVALPTRSRRAVALRARLEHFFIEISGAGGFRAVEEVIATLNAGGRRVLPADRLVLLVGKLEADVNNGAFAQYLDNKGRPRARAALSALRRVGAHRTARMLERAMGPRVTEGQRDAFDRRFYAVPEDLAVLTARHVGLQPDSRRNR